MPTDTAAPRERSRPGASRRLMSYCCLAMYINVCLSGIEQASIDRWRSPGGVPEQINGRWNTLTQPSRGQEHRPDELDNALPASYGGISAAVA